MKIDNPEHRNLLLKAVSQLSVPWTPVNDVEAVKKQQEIRGLMQSIAEAEVPEQTPLEIAK